MRTVTQAGLGQMPSTQLDMQGHQMVFSPQTGDLFSIQLHLSLSIFEVRVGMS
jgi:hypothetical protein